MGIDGIGKGGPPAGVTPPSSAGQPSTDAEFRVADVTVAQPQSDLSRLDSGEITRDEYLRLRVDHATSHLEGRLSPELIGELRERLLAEFEMDPVLQRLAQRAAGTAAADNER
jgi:hypothetical protein